MAGMADYAQSVLVYRVSGHNPPEEDDMKSQHQLGTVPRRPLRPEDEVAWREVSTFDTREKAAQMSCERKLGDYIVELEIPDEIERSQDPTTGHVGLRGTTPDQLLGCVRNVWHRDEVG